MDFSNKSVYLFTFFTSAFFITFCLMIFFPKLKVLFLEKLACLCNYDYVSLVCLLRKTQNQNCAVFFVFAFGFFSVLYQISKNEYFVKETIVYVENEKKNTKTNVMYMKMCIKNLCVVQNQDYLITYCNGLCTYSVFKCKGFK